MPLPNDEKVLALANDILTQFGKLFGDHPGFRPAHAKGAMFIGTFTSSAGASSLTRAPHVTRPATRVTARFSNSTGIPLLPDNDLNANPRGLAIRFHLEEHVHTDIVSHSTDGFPARTGAEFLDFLRAVGSSDPAHLSGSPLEAFLKSHPAALTFVQTPKPAPVSFATETYFGVTAMRFSNAAGASRFGRFRIVPETGSAHLDDAAARAKGPGYLFEEIAERVGKGPARFKLQVQVARSDDVVDDATVHWPEDRQLVELGKIELTAPVPNSPREEKQIIFDPIPRVDGIDPSADPLLELRAAVYLISGRRRRSATRS
jgi:catalase